MPNGIEHEAKGDWGTQLNLTGQNGGKIEVNRNMVLRNYTGSEPNKYIIYIKHGGISSEAWITLNDEQMQELFSHYLRMHDEYATQID